MSGDIKRLAYNNYPNLEIRPPELSEKKKT